ncbi:toll/interleukin-1 receptor domain-containing protein [Streptomyces atriruber]|uniref:toll/interleukin-1 receptor domain-containing protein n=1 Tax=Streptomyces atriruber TaxID=545121 RepID=UPI0006E1D91E|nr:toll/interleukin-1 receptor domain-containing protein [Streptomyces atriruber]
MDPAAFFYTSCVRADGWRALTRFHTDLEYQLRIQEGFGVSGLLGAVEEPESAREGGVTRAGVMIVLYSSRYFTDRGAGLEWAVFDARMRHHEGIRGVSARGCLVPLCWKPVADEQVPDNVRTSVEGPGAFDWLRQYGLESLAASPRAEDEVRYYALLEQLAKTIAEAGRTELEPLDLADAHDLDPAFGSESAVQAGQLAETRVEGWSHLREILDTGTLQREPGSVAISYVGADQPWADWMSEVLVQRGHGVVQRRWRASQESLKDAVAQARAAAERMLVIFSRNYFAAGNTDPTEWADTFVGSPGRPSQAVLVQIDAAPRPLLVRDAQVVVLAGADPAEAEQLIEQVLPETPQQSAERGSGR